MATATAPDATPTRTRPLRPAHLRSRDDLVTVALGLWLMVGIFVDGWAHETLGDTLESFFTPWHALFYTAFAANALWIGWLMRHPRAGRLARWGLPWGYDLALVGVFTFGLGGFVDMLWHTAFGIETNVQALLSPPHLVLFAGVLLIVTAPLRSAWAAPGEAAPTLRAFLPPLLSATSVAGFTAFMNMYLWGLGRVNHTQDQLRYYNQPAFTGTRRMLLNMAQTENLAQILITTLLLVTPVLYLTLRWRLPFGSAAILYTTVALLMGAMLGYVVQFPERVLAVTLAGLLTDALTRALRPAPARRWAFRAFAFLAPLALWLPHFALVPLRVGGEEWDKELWGGITLMAGLAGFALSLLMLPPALPAGD